MGGRLAGWWRLQPGERVSFLGYLVALPLISLGLRLFGTLRTRRWLEANSERDIQPLDQAALQNSIRLGQLVEVAGNQSPLPSNCLRKSLLLYWLLRRRGQSPRFVIGVRKQPESFDAHAWVQLGDVPLLSWGDGFVPFESNEWGVAGLTQS